MSFASPAVLVGLLVLPVLLLLYVAEQRRRRAALVLGRRARDVPRAGDPRALRRLRRHRRALDTQQRGHILDI